MLLEMHGIKLILTILYHKNMKIYSQTFEGKKEFLLNHACQLYQLTRPNKVGEVMNLIRQCQPSSLEEWEQ